MEIQNGNGTDDEGNKKALIALAVLGSILVLTWAVATLFEIALAKALAGVIVFLFCAFIVLLMAGIA
jgi:hypothetical protein